MLRGTYDVLLWVTAVRRLSIAVMYSMVTSAWTPAHALAPGSEPTGRTPSPLVSGMDTGALRSAAHQYPYATLALLQVLQSSLRDASGVIYFESVAAPVLASLLMNSRDDREIEGLLSELRWNPYSDSTSAIEVKWVSRPVQGEAQLLEFRARLIMLKGDASSAAEHALLEPPVSVLLIGDGVRFFDPATESDARATSARDIELARRMGNPQFCFGDRLRLPG